MSSTSSDDTDYIPIKSRTLITPKMRTPPLSVKQKGIVVLLVPGLYKIQWIIGTFAGLSCKVVCHR